MNIEQKLPPATFCWAAPSWVLPGTIAENVEFLRGRTKETALCLFDTLGSLAYTQKDLPINEEEALQAGMPAMRYHVHLPSDLFPNETNVPPEEEGAVAARTAFNVFNKVRYLTPSSAVLHPPALTRPKSNLSSPAQENTPEKGSTQWASYLLESFLQTWQKLTPIPLLLENTVETPLTLLNSSLFGRTRFGVCLDVAHLIHGRQQDFFKTFSPAMIRLIHWSAPGDSDQHLPLSCLSEREQFLARQILMTTPEDVVHVIEVFYWKGVETSLAVLQKLMATTKRSRERTCPHMNNAFRA